MRKNMKAKERSPLFLLWQTKILSKMAIFHIALMSNADYWNTFHLSGKSTHAKRDIFCKIW